MSYTAKIIKNQQKNNDKIKNPLELRLAWISYCYQAGMSFNIMFFDFLSNPILLPLGPGMAEGWEKGAFTNRVPINFNKLQ